jgi:hypothetical protein
MDRTSLNVVSLILGGAGLLTVLTGFNVPQTRIAYFGENPYQIKRDAIGGVMAAIFTVVALSGIVMQVIAEVLGESLPTRLHSRDYYLVVSLVSVLGAAVLVRDPAYPRVIL